ncbi:MAG: OmpA family protein [Bacteroidia bacterium]
MKKLVFLLGLIVIGKLQSFSQVSDSTTNKTPVVENIQTPVITDSAKTGADVNSQGSTTTVKTDSAKNNTETPVVKTDSAKTEVQPKKTETTIAPNILGLKTTDASVKTDSVIITVKNMGEAINTPYSEFAPIISADGSMMIFTSKRPIGAKDSSKRTERMENVFVSYYNDSLDVWSPAKLLGPSVNQPKRNNSAIALSNDGQNLLLYKGEPDGNIYASSLKGEDWSIPLVLPQPINSSRHETSASISPDGKTIYFVSDRKHGQGGLDIWYCKQDKRGNWGEAKNMGPDVNTKRDEEGVYIHPDGKTLYFSSKGHNSVGGFDVYKTVFEKGKWSKPVNLGAPINTVGDDLFFVITADGSTGYYSSGRDGGSGKKDIYKITFKYPENQKSESASRLTLFKGVVIDYETFEPLAADMEIIDNDSNEVITSIKSNSVTGKFLISLPAGKNYGIAVKKDGYLFYSENFNIPESAAFKKIDKHVPLQKLNVGNKINAKNIFYDLGKATLRPESKTELLRLVALMKANQNLRIEVASYTDSDGSEQYNLQLSQARAQSVVDYLISAGVNTQQLVAKGYGEADPLFSNETEEGREINRRTEFKILNDINK